MGQARQATTTATKATLPSTEFAQRLSIDRTLRLLMPYLRVTRKVFLATILWHTGDGCHNLLVICFIGRIMEVPRFQFWVSALEVFPKPSYFDGSCKLRQEKMMLSCPLLIYSHRLELRQQYENGQSRGGCLNQCMGSSSVV